MGIPNPVYRVAGWTANWMYRSAFPGPALQPAAVDTHPIFGYAGRLDPCLQDGAAISSISNRP